MADSVLTRAERAFFSELESRGVRYMIVGMSGALLQGARGATEDIDIWFEDVSDTRIGEAARAAGGFWVSGSFGMHPPRLGGDELGTRLDVVTHMDGLEGFVSEYGNVRLISVDGIAIPVLPLKRIIESKRAAGRDKDRALLHSLEDALAVLEKGGEEIR